MKRLIAFLVLALIFVAQAGYQAGGTDLTATDLRYGATLGTATASTTNTALDCSTATSWTIQMETNTTFTITGITSGYDAAIKLNLVQDATGSRTVTWPANTTWGYGLEPTLTTNAAATDIIYLTTIDGGTSFIGVPSLYDVK